MNPVSLNPALASTNSTLTVRPLTGRSAQAAQRQLDQSQLSQAQASQGQLASEQVSASVRPPQPVVTRSGYQTTRDGDTATFRSTSETESRDAETSQAAPPLRNTAGAPRMSLGLDLFA